MKLNKCEHADCKYRASEYGEQANGWRCNYSDITGHSRIAWHMKQKYSIDPAECKLYESGKKLKPKPVGVVITKSEVGVSTTGRLKREPRKKELKPRVERKPTERAEKMLALYKEGKTDTEIAEALGVARNTVCNFRHHRNLPMNASVTERKKPLVRRMLEAGFSNTEIIKLAHISDGTMSSWRHKFGLVGKQPKDEEAKAEILRELAVSSEQLEIKEEDI